MIVFLVVRLVAPKQSHHNMSCVCWRALKLKNFEKFAILKHLKHVFLNYDQQYDSFWQRMNPIWICTLIKVFCCDMLCQYFNPIVPIKPSTEKLYLNFYHLYSTTKRWINKTKNEDKSLRSTRWRKHTKEGNIWKKWMRRLVRKKSWNSRHWDRNIWMHQRIFIIR